MTLQKEEWFDASVIFGRSRVVLNGLFDILLPPCLIEILLLAILFPSLITLTIVSPFLVLPTLMILLVGSKTSLKRRWTGSQVSLRPSFMLVRLPGVHITHVKPRRIEIVSANAFIVHIGFSNVKVEFRNECDMTRCLKVLQDRVMEVKGTANEEHIIYLRKKV